MKKNIYLLILQIFLIGCSSIEKNNNYSIATMDKNGNGSFIQLYENKISIKSTGSYINYTRDGSFKYFYENGKIKKIENYKNGYLNGKYLEFYENNNPKVYIDYLNGDRVGIFYSYYSNGTLKEKGIYKNGLRNGVWNYYKTNGSFNFNINYKNKGYFSPEDLNINYK